MGKRVRACGRECVWWRESVCVGDRVWERVCVGESECVGERVSVKERVSVWERERE